ncbi:response regulator [Vulgatibacter sp.]|uniref:response regulator n=1 Tax=Vulgatibacter sp. TaxID=1971226 RepID=UPI00356188DA
MAEPLRVLVVDDDALHLSMVQRLLGGYGIEVQTSSSALGVSNTVRHNRPDVVLLDVNMAQLSGDRVLGVARRHAPPGTQFLLYSANDESTLRNLARDVEADGWISKSADPEELVRKLEEHGRRRKAQG